MFKGLKVFQLSYAMASHAAQRQAIVSQNVANADTPGYAAKDVTPFAEVLSSSAGSFEMRSTRSQHVSTAASGLAEPVTRATPNSPNGNGISIEEELLKSVDAKRQHDRALAIYKSGMNVLRSSLGKV
ncbi:FlgB family protein [Shimia sp. SDUM112013]|uniref:FlgB family protein n=1 Tax=Shimia sp. SDUM112013 TaxID=3136160 RepID=UPI0032ECBFD6